MPEVDTAVEHELIHIPEIEENPYVAVDIDDSPLSRIEHGHADHVCGPECSHTQEGADRLAEQLFSENEAKHAQHGEKEHICSAHCEHAQADTDAFAARLFGESSKSTTHEKDRHHEKEHVCNASCEHSQEETDRFADSLFESAKKQAEHGQEGHVCHAHCEHAQERVDRLADELFADSPKSSPTTEQASKPEVRSEARAEAIDRHDEHTIHATETADRQHAIDEAENTAGKKPAAPLDNKATAQSHTVEAAERPASLDSTQTERTDQSGRTTDTELTKVQTSPIEDMRRNTTQDESTKIAAISPDNAQGSIQYTDVHHTETELAIDPRREPGNPSHTYATEASIDWSLVQPLQAEQHTGAEAFPAIDGERSETVEDEPYEPEAHAWLNDILGVGDYEIDHADNMDIHTKRKDIIPAETGASFDTTRTSLNESNGNFMQKSQASTEHIVTALPELDAIASLLPAIAEQMDGAHKEALEHALDAFIETISHPVDSFGDRNVAQKQLEILCQHLGIRKEELIQALREASPDTEQAALFYEILYGLKKWLSLEHSLEFSTSRTQHIAPSTPLVRDIKTLGQFMLSIFHGQRVLHAA